MENERDKKFIKDEQLIRKINEILFPEHSSDREALENLQDATTLILFKNIKLIIDVVSTPQDLMYLFEKFQNVWSVESHELLKQIIYQLKDKEFIEQFEEIIKDEK